MFLLKFVLLSQKLLFKKKIFRLLKFGISFIFLSKKNLDILIYMYKNFVLKKRVS